MNVKKCLHILLVLSMLVTCLLSPTESAFAAKGVYQVNRYGELTDYSGSPVVPIRSNVSAINKNAFNGVKITQFSASANQYLKTVNGVLYSKDGALLIKCPSEKQGSFTVPSSVRKIAHSAFEDCTKLTQITIPDSVTTIEDQAFRNCSALRKIRLSNYITSIPEEAFYGCSSLTSVTIPARASSVGSDAFYNCQSLKSIYIPDSVKTVDGSAFSKCLNLEKARLSSKMSVISPNLFANCTKLTTVENTGNIEEIEWNAFQNCVQLKSYSYTNKLDEISSNAFKNCLNLGTVHIGKGTRRISYSAFNGAAEKFVVDSDNPNYSSRNGMLLDENGEYLIQVPVSMKGEINIPKGVTSISSNALVRGQFSSVTVPEGITTIGSHLFSNCSNLKSIYLPASVKKITNSTYYYRDYNLNSLERIVVSKDNPNYRSQDGVVYSSDMKTMVFFPTGKKGSFHLPNTCKYIGNQMKRNKLSSIHVAKNSKYYRSEDGVLYDSKGAKISCFPMRKKRYRIPAAVKDIRYLNQIKADLKCKAISVSPKNKRFSSKAGVIFDGDEETLLFYPTKKKGAYKIPVSTHYIAQNAFDDAHNLTTLTITKNVKRSRSSTFHFRDCRNLKTINVNQGSLNYISMNFSGCAKLSKLTFPSTIMTTNLKNLPEGVTIHGWKNTYAKEAAENADGKFVSRGTIPNIVTGPRIKKIIDKYQLSWNAVSGVSGYQVYTPYSTIKNLNGSGNTSCFIKDIYKYQTIYIRAYQIVNKKKVYGKARSISIY